MRDEFVWSEKFRPTKIDDCILPEETKETFKEFLKQNNIPTLLLTGGPGTGKTTVARALCEELGCDYIVINSSLEGNIDTLRNKIADFASSVSFSGGRKYVILDEADGLNPQSTQPALRAFIQDFSKNCGFIFTCNFPQKLIEPLRSRTTEIVFKINKKEAAALAGKFFKRVCKILDAENVEYDKAVVAHIVEKYYPDFRKTLNELQKFAARGKIDNGATVGLSDEDFKVLIIYLKDRKWNDMRKWLVESFDGDAAELMRKFYDNSEKYMKGECIPEIVVIISKYQYQNAFVADPEINLVAMMTEIMMAAQWK